MKVASYLIYAIFYEAITLGGTAYIVFVLGFSGWWWVLGILISSGIYSPERWSALWDESIAERYRKQKQSSE